ncbi:MAG: arginase family protein [Bacteroidales bacterium]|nr:arginase family protein [Bacteroidales bacterium]
MIFALNLSGSLLEEGFDGPVTDLSGLLGTNCYCTPEAEREITSALADYGPEGIHLTDTGDYHYLSLFWMRKIEEDFSLILFDHHSDDQAGAFGNGMLTCGSWVGVARESLEHMKADLWIGGPEEPDYASVLDNDRPVYLSIDLDVLSRTFAVTDWDQGDMSPGELIHIISRIASRHRIIGIDICGGITRAKGATPADLAKNASLRKSLICSMSALLSETDSRN